MQLNFPSCRKQLNLPSVWCCPKQLNLTQAVWNSWTCWLSEAPKPDTSCRKTAEPASSRKMPEASEPDTSSGNNWTCLMSEAAGRSWTWHKLSETGESAGYRKLPEAPEPDTSCRKTAEPAGSRKMPEAAEPDRSCGKQLNLWGLLEAAERGTGCRKQLKLTRDRSWSWSWSWSWSCEAPLAYLALCLSSPYPSACLPLLSASCGSACLYVDFWISAFCMSICLFISSPSASCLSAWMPVYPSACPPFACLPFRLLPVRLLPSSRLPLSATCLSACPTSVSSSFLSASCQPTCLPLCPCPCLSVCFSVSCLVRIFCLHASTACQPPASLPVCKSSSWSSACLFSCFLILQAVSVYRCSFCFCKAFYKFLVAQCTLRKAKLFALCKLAKHSRILNWSTLPLKFVCSKPKGREIRYT